MSDPAEKVKYEVEHVVQRLREEEGLIETKAEEVVKPATDWADRHPLSALALSLLALWLVLIGAVKVLIWLIHHA